MEYLHNIKLVYFFEGKCSDEYYKWYKENIQTIFLYAHNNSTPSKPQFENFECLKHGKDDLNYITRNEKQK